MPAGLSAVRYLRAGPGSAADWACAVRTHLPLLPRCTRQHRRRTARQSAGAPWCRSIAAASSRFVLDLRRASAPLRCIARSAEAAPMWRGPRRQDRCGWDLPVRRITWRSLETNGAGSFWATPTANARAPGLSHGHPPACGPSPSTSASAARRSVGRSSAEWEAAAL